AVEDGFLRNDEDEGPSLWVLDHGGREPHAQLLATIGAALAVTVEEKDRGPTGGGAGRDHDRPRVGVAADGEVAVDDLHGLGDDVFVAGGAGGGAPGEQGEEGREQGDDDG